MCGSVPLLRSLTQKIWTLDSYYLIAISFRCLGRIAKVLQLAQMQLPTYSVTWQLRTLPFVWAACEHPHPHCFSCYHPSFLLVSSVLFHTISRAKTPSPPPRECCGCYQTMFHKLLHFLSSLEQSTFMHDRSEHLLLVTEVPPATGYYLLDKNYSSMNCTVRSFKYYLV